MKVIIGIFYVLFMLDSTVALAQSQVRSLLADQRIKVVSYQQNNVVPVDAAIFTVTQIVFGNAEVIENIQNGDLAAWTVSVQKGLPNMLFLKPTVVGSDTNMTVITNLHTYYFNLTSHSSKNAFGAQTIYAIHFIYPGLHLPHFIRHINLSHGKYNWDYSFYGARAILPLQVFDDGRFTYMKLQRLQPVPAIFAVDNAKGKEAVVNFRRRGQYLVIQQTAPQFTLRQGQHYVVSVFNNKLIRRLRHNEGMR